MTLPRFPLGYVLEAIGMEKDYGVFVWRGDGHYKRSDALAVYIRYEAAQLFIERQPNPGTLVVRRLSLISRP